MAEPAPPDETARAWCWRPD